MKYTDDLINWILSREPTDWPFFPHDIYRSMIAQPRFAPNGEPDRKYTVEEAVYEADWAWLNDYHSLVLEIEVGLASAIQQAMRWHARKLQAVNEANKRLSKLRKRYMKQTKPPVGQPRIAAAEAEAKAAARATERQGTAVLSRIPG